MLDDLGSEPTLVLDCRNNLGESVVWDERLQMLRWVNIHQGEVWSWHPGTGEQNMVSLDQRIGAIAMRERGDLVAALSSGFSFLDSDGHLEQIVEVERELTTTRLNDGRADPAGRFVCGGMNEGSPQTPISAIYALNPDGSLTSLLGGVACSNSTCWSPDGKTMYFTDMPTREIVAFDYDLSVGAVSNKRVFADLKHEPGLADGSTVDAEGYLWNAQWGGKRLVRYAPDGSVDRVIPVPVTNPTCLAFGGPQLDILFITSAWFGLSEESHALEPSAGSIFAFRPGVRGMLEHRFAG